MIKKAKRTVEDKNEEVSPPKKQKISHVKKPKIQKSTEPNSEKQSDKKGKVSKVTKDSKSLKHADNTKKEFKAGKKPFKKNPKDKNKFEKPADWNEFKKKKKELQVKRKQTKNLYEVIVQAKKIGENLRRKALKGGQEERNRLTTELHDLLGGEGNYPKLVLTHDMARIVQYLLKFGSEQIRKDVSKELTPATVQMLQSKYAKFCVKRMLKYGDSSTRSAVIKACYGHAVKLASHSISASIFDYGYTTWASPLERRHLVQEFYGDMYKQSKDDSIKHISDAYEKSPDMKIAVLGAMKSNLARILNKELLDSHIAQTALMQYLQECSSEDRSEMISQLASHSVVLSNSKEGAMAAMLCFWHGTNKDRKVSMKALKEHVLDLCRHEHAHNTIITILDSTDDTVLLNKMLLGEIVSHSVELAADDWGRRVLLWLVAPAVQAHFHPKFVNELKDGKEKSVSKKDTEVRRKEILGYVVNPLLKKVSSEPSKWLSSGSIAVVTLAILKAGSGEELQNAFENIATVITDPDWKIKDGESAMAGIEHPGLHMILKKLIQYDKDSTERPKFSPVLVDLLTDELIQQWIGSTTGCNRACFFLLNVIECAAKKVQKHLKNILNNNIQLITEQKNNKGADLLLMKIKE